MKIEVDKFYTWSSFVTVAGMASMLWVVAGTASRAFDWEYPDWFPLALAAGFVVMGDFAHRKYGTQEPWSSIPGRVPLWLVNSCLVYTTAIGGASTASSAGVKEEPSARGSAIEVTPEPKATRREEVPPPAPEEARPEHPIVPSPPAAAGPHVAAVPPPTAASGVDREEPATAHGAGGGAPSGEAAAKPAARSLDDLLGPGTKTTLTIDQALGKEAPKGFNRLAHSRLFGVRAE